MKGSSTPIKVEMTPDGWQIAEYAGRVQRFTVWRQDASYYFTDAKHDAEGWVKRQAAWGVT